MDTLNLEDEYVRARDFWHNTFDVVDSSSKLEGYLQAHSSFQKILDAENAPAPMYGLTAAFYLNLVRFSLEYGSPFIPRINGFYKRMESAFEKAIASDAHELYARTTIFWVRALEVPDKPLPPMDLNMRYDGYRPGRELNVATYLYEAHRAVFIEATEALTSAFQYKANNGISLEQSVEMIRQICRILPTVKTEHDIDFKPLFSAILTIDDNLQSVIPTGGFPEAYNLEYYRILAGLLADINELDGTSHKREEPKRYDTRLHKQGINMEDISSLMTDDD